MAKAATDEESLVVLLDVTRRPAGIGIFGMRIPVPEESDESKWRPEEQGELHDWFAIDIDINKGVDATELNCPIPGLSISRAQYAAAVPVDSTLYIIGGVTGEQEQVFSRCVWVAHLYKNSPDSGVGSIVCDAPRLGKWMKNGRCVFGSCAVIQDTSRGGFAKKIFVFGGGKVTTDNYAEVYDVERRKWSIVKDGMRQEWVEFGPPVTAVVEWQSSLFILLYFLESRSLYYYDPCLNISDVFDLDFASKGDVHHLLQMVPATVALTPSSEPTTLLYCVESEYNTCSLRVYHLARKTWLGTLTGFRPSYHLPDYKVLRRAPSVHLVPLASRASFCAVWELGPGTSFKPLSVRCVKFSIGDGYPLTAVIESCTDYDIPRCRRLQQCIPVCVRSKVIGEAA